MREPTCRHKSTCRVSSHEDIVAASRTDEPIASIYCCDRQECLDKMRFWVQRRRGVPLWLSRSAGR